MAQQPQTGLEGEVSRVEATDFGTWLEKSGLAVLRAPLTQFDFDSVLSLTALSDEDLTELCADLKKELGSAFSLGKKGKFLNAVRSEKESNSVTTFDYSTILGMSPEQRDTWVALTTKIAQLQKHILPILKRFDCDIAYLQEKYTALLQETLRQLIPFIPKIIALLTEDYNKYLSIITQSLTSALSEFEHIQIQCQTELESNPSSDKIGTMITGKFEELKDKPKTVFDDCKESIKANLKVRPLPKRFVTIIDELGSLLIPVVFELISDYVYYLLLHVSVRASSLRVLEKSANEHDTYVHIFIRHSVVTEELTRNEIIARLRKLIPSKCEVKQVTTIVKEIFEGDSKDAIELSAEDVAPVFDKLLPLKTPSIISFFHCFEGEMTRVTFEEVPSHPLSSLCKTVGNYSSSMAQKYNPDSINAQYSGGQKNSVNNADDFTQFAVFVCFTG